MTEEGESPLMIGNVQAGTVPKGAIVIEALAIIKCLDEDGDSMWLIRQTPDLAVIEGLGMADILHSNRMLHAQGCYTKENGEDDDAS